MNTIKKFLFGTVLMTLALAAPSALAATTSGMDQALDALAEKIAAGESIAEVYVWKKPSFILPCALVDITDDWTNGTIKTEYNYIDPVIFTGAGALAYNEVKNEITFGGGLAVPNATSLDVSRELGGNKVTVKGEFRGGISASDDGFVLTCDKLKLNNVTYRGKVSNTVTDEDAIEFAGINWDLTGGTAQYGSINDFQWYKNVDSTCVDQYLLIKAASGSVAQQQTGAYVIASGEGLSTKKLGDNKSGTFTLKAGEDAGTAITIGGNEVKYQGRNYQLLNVAEKYITLAACDKQASAKLDITSATGTETTPYDINGYGDLFAKIVDDETFDGSGAMYVQENAYATGSNLIFIGNSFKNGFGGAINNYGTLTINGTADFLGNNATQGAAFLNLGTLNLTGDTAFTGNSAETGAAICSNGSGALTIDGSATFTGNSGMYGGAIYMHSGTITLNDGATFTGNKTTSESGAIGNYWGTLTINGGATFAGNSSNLGGAINNSKDITINGGATFTGNSATEDGGAIVNYGTVTLNDGATFTGNSATEDGGAVWNKGTVVFDGLMDLQTAGDTWYNAANAIVNWDLTGGLEQYGCIAHFERYANEDATVKQLISITDDQPAGDYVIATGDFTNVAGKDTFVIKPADLTVKINGDVVTSADGWYGYKLMTEEAGKTTNLVFKVSKYTCTRTVLEAGQSTNLVAGVYTAAPQTIEGINGYGAVFFVNEGAMLTGTNITFEGNATSLGYGGAIYNKGSVTLKDTVFRNNTASSGGALRVQYAAATATLDGVTFDGNSSEWDGAISNFGGTIILAGRVELKTASDYWCNKSNSTVSWDLTGGLEHYGTLVNFQLFTNLNASVAQKILIADDQQPGDYVIASGDFSKIKTAYTENFSITNVLGGAAATIKIGGISQLNGTWWSLAVEDNDKLVLKTVETVTLSDVMTGVATNASEAVVSVNGQTIEAVGPGYQVPKGYAITVVYAAKDDYMFAGGAKTKTMTVGPLTGNYAMTDADKPVAEAQWATEREVGIDTRERIVVAAPEEVLPIAYATNFWDEVGNLRYYTTAKVQVREPTYEPEYRTLIMANGNGYVAWQPAEGAFGKYEIINTCANDQGWPEVSFDSTIIYSTPFPLTIVEPAEGGSIVAITNGIEATGTFDVLGFENVTIAAKPAEHWQVKEMVATTNDVALLLAEAKTSLTNRFEMPCCETVVTGAFEIADTYRAELRAAVDAGAAAAKLAIEAMENNRLTKDEVNKFKASVDDKATSAKGAISAATKPYQGDAATNGFTVAIAEIGSDAKELSDSKPWESVIAEDFSMFGDYDPATGTFTWNDRAWTNGVSAFTSITACFTNETYGMFMTNLHVFGQQTIAQEPMMLAPWTLDLVTVTPEGGEAIPAIVSVDPTKTTPSVLFNFTNTLAHIVGQGTILLGKTDVPTTVYDDFIAERPEIENIIVKNVNLEPWRNPTTQNMQIEILDGVKTETTEEGETIVLLPGIETQTGGIDIIHNSNATNDVVIAGQLAAPNGDVTINNGSTNTLTITGTVAGRKVTVYNTGRHDGVEGAILATKIVADGDVHIENRAHLEADVTSGGKIDIQNGSMMTLVGSYTGDTIDIYGNSDGAISNAVFTADTKVIMTGYNVLTGPFTIIAPTIDNSSTVAFSVANDNHTTWLNDFDQIVDTGSFEVKVDAAQTDGDVVGVYTIASNATTAAGQTFALTGGSLTTTIDAVDAANAAEVEAKTLYIGAKAYSLVVDANDALVFTVKYGKFAVTFDAMGGTWPTTTKTNIDEFVNRGYELPVPAPTRAGYTLNGWYANWKAEDATEITNAAPLIVSAEHTLYAKWTKNPATDEDLVLDDLQNGLPFKTILPNQYAGQDWESVTTPLYLESIGSRAFYDNANLTVLNLTAPRSYADASPSTLRIGQYAFAKTGLRKVVIPSFVSAIDANAFADCAYLTNVVITGNGATIVDPYAFKNCGKANARMEGGKHVLTFTLSETFIANNPSFTNAVVTLNPNVKVVIDVKTPTVEALNVTKLVPPVDGRATLTLKATGTVSIAPNAANVRIYFGNDLATRKAEVSPVTVSPVVDNEVTVEVDVPKYGKSGFFNATVED